MLEAINVIAELERIGVGFKFAGGDEIKVHCPFHDDHSESCCINVEKRMFICQAAGCPTGNKGGDFITYLAKKLETDRYVVYHQLAERYDFDTDKTVDPKSIERYHKEIWKAKPLLKALYDRGLTDEMIRKYRIGFYNKRIQIPVKNRSGFYVNLRKYLPGAPGADKMKNMKGHGDIRLFPIEQLKYDTIVLAGGEIKAIVTAELMNAYDIGAISTTGGEGNWDAGFTDHFKGKNVFICYDVDNAGRESAQSIGARLRSVCEYLSIIQLPLDVDKYPHGDLNDYFGAEKKTPESFLDLLKEAEEWVPAKVERFDASGETISVGLHECTIPENITKRIKTCGIVGVIDTNPYIVPRTVKIGCDNNHNSCHICPVFSSLEDEGGYVTMGISSESPFLLEMIDSSKSGQQDAMKGGCGIPMECKTANFTIIDYHSVEDINIIPQLEISSRSVDDINQPCFFVGKGLELNENYEFTGRVYPHPRTQQSILLASAATPVSDALSQYHPSKEELEILKAFQVSEHTVDGVREKLDHIYSDFEANITNIYKRRTLHFAIDLAFHSPLLLEFDKRPEKGWVEVLIIGDSAQGKTETSKHLMAHYQLGEKVECKNATRAGLLGGLKQKGQRFFISWGVIPSQDKRIVILEELKGASEELIGSITDMRSSGIAELPMIEKRRTHARTRLICISNPRSSRGLHSYNFGLEAIKELIGGLEDIRRFDLAIVLSAEDIDSEELNELQRFRPRVDHLYTSELCRRLILWSWTRLPEQIHFTDKAFDTVLDESIRLCRIFVDTIPLIDRGSVRFKIARLSASLAARLFSCDDKCDKLIVKPYHVRYISAFLEEHYSSKIFGYKDFSDAIRMTQILDDPDYVKGKILQSTFPEDLIRNILYATKMDMRDIQDWSGLDSHGAAELLSTLVRKHAIYREGRYYRKSSEFIGLLKDMMRNETTFDDLPDHIKKDSEEEF